MPRFDISEPHGLLQDEALKRIKETLAELKTHFVDKISDLHEDWNGNTCKFSLSVKGFSGSGTMIVEPSEVKISGNLPFLALPFKVKIEYTIREWLKKLLA